ncbi:MAG: hypothetical protein R3D61_08890 [Defluviimonas denitrificans]
MPEARPNTLPVLGLLAALAGFLVWEVAALLHAGVFEYPLDDVYIHLAIASEIMRGGYGVNAGEPASASSSILYPLLLLPFPETGFQRLLPLFWNTLAVAGGGWVWGRIVAEARLTGLVAVCIAVGAPVGLNMSGVGFTGMEAAGHILASLMIVLGLWRALTGRGVAGWFIAAAIIAPLLRYEGLALCLMAALVLFLHGQRRAGFAIAVPALGIVAGFSLFLVALGLPPVPGSILAKTATLGAGGGPFDGVLMTFAENVSQPAGALLAVLTAVALLLPVAVPSLRRGPGFWLLMAVGLSALAHLLAGQIGWLNRYEPYILLSLLGAILLAASPLEPGAGRIAGGAALAAILAGALVYIPSTWTYYAWNPRALHLQQVQMARFARDFVKAPVMVNDLGRVVWGNPYYVLDIFGLGSDEARRARLDGPKPADGWAAPLAAKHGVKAAMVYDHWFGTAVGPDWVRVGALEMHRARGLLGGWTVAIYATDPAYAPELRGKLEAFAPTLPADAYITHAGAGT